MTGVPIQNILFTVFQSIFQVFLLCLAGFMLSFKGIVDKPTSKTLNHLNISLFTPALLFSKVAYFLSPAKLRQLWVIPIFFILLTGLSALLAHWLARACRLKRSQVNFATGAAMFMNSNSLPVALMQSLATTVPLLKWGPDDTYDAMFGRSLTYLVVFSTLGMILRWSYGVRILSQADESDPPSAAPTSNDTDGDQYSASKHINSPLPTAQLIDYETETDDRRRHIRPLHSHPSPPAQRHGYLHPRLHSHLPAVPTSLGDQSESEDSDEATEGDSEDTIAPQSELIDTGFSTDAEEPTSAPHLPSSSFADTRIPRWYRPDRPSFFKRIFSFLASLSPPLIASLLALFCVLVPPAQRLLNSKEMIPFKGALSEAGECSVPLTLIVLGGWFWDGETKPNKNKTGQEPDEREVKGGSNGQGRAQSKGKGIEKRHLHGNSAIPTLIGERHDQDVPQAPAINNAALRQRFYTMPYSRDSSSGSLSSVIGAFGDVFLARMHPRGSARRARRVLGNVSANEGDVEPGLLVTHAETLHETSENGSGRTSRSQSRSGYRADPSPRSSSTPLSPASPTRETNPPGETLTITITLLVRMIIIPLVITPLIALVSRFGWGGEVFEDPVFIVSCMLLTASPPALTLAQISQRAKVTAGADTQADTFSPFERLLSRTVFWSYCALTPPMMLVSVMVGLLLIGA